MDPSRLTLHIKSILAEIPAGVTPCAVVKGRVPEEVSAALAAGIQVLGSNYAQETVALRQSLAVPAQWRFIGHLQSNKIRDLLPCIDTVDTVDRPKIVRLLAERAASLGRILPVLLEVNSGREDQKSGALPESVESLAQEVLQEPSLRLEGLMTMGPAHLDGEALRPFFAITRECHGRVLRLCPTANILSMGMSGSWRAAVAEGANLVRLGSVLFGPRPTRGVPP